MLRNIVLVLCCLPKVKSEEFNKTKKTVGRLGEELVLNFWFSELIVEYDKYIAERDGKRIPENEINDQDLKKDSDIRFEKKITSMSEQIIFDPRKPPDVSASSRTAIFITNDTFVVKKIKLQKEDAGIYFIEFKMIPLGRKALIIEEPESNEGLYAATSNIGLIVGMVIVVLGIVMTVVVLIHVYKKYQHKGKNETMDLNQRQLITKKSRINNSRNGLQNEGLMTDFI